MLGLSLANAADPNFRPVLTQGALKRLQFDIVRKAAVPFSLVKRGNSALQCRSPFRCHCRCVNVQVQLKVLSQLICRPVAVGYVVT